MTLFHGSPVGRGFCVCKKGCGLTFEMEKAVGDRVDLINHLKKKYKSYYVFECPNCGKSIEVSLKEVPLRIKIKVWIENLIM